MTSRIFLFIFDHRGHHDQIIHDIAENLKLLSNFNCHGLRMSNLFLHLSKQIPRCRDLDFTELKCESTSSWCYQSAEAKFLKTQ